MVQLRCSTTGCAHEFTDAEIQAISNVDRLNAIQEIRFQLALAAMPGARRCPTLDCQNVFLNEENQRGEYVCPSCNHHYCANCLVNHPVHVACGAAAAHPNRDAWRTWAPADQRLRKPCPNCDAFIEKNDGCNHMTCRLCHHEFCWLCLDPYHGHERFEYYATEGEHLITSAAMGNLVHVQMFLAQGVPVDDQHRNHGGTALMAAAAQGHVAIVEYLLAHGAQVNRQNNAGQTALMHARNEQIRQMIRAAMPAPAPVARQVVQPTRPVARAVVPVAQPVAHQPAARRAVNNNHPVQRARPVARAARRAPARQAAARRPVARRAVARTTRARRAPVRRATVRRVAVRRAVARRVVRRRR